VTPVESEVTAARAKLFSVEDAPVTVVIGASLAAPSIKQLGGARRILITTEPKILVSRIDVEGLRRPPQYNKE
jgi:hypothetical protein